MKKTVVGIIAHVDAGKTTLAETLLYKSGKIRKLGRVDNGDTALDTHTLEKERGITIFAGQSLLNCGDTEIYLLDTPGHIDFSAETERVLKVLDYAVLVISGTDGVQSHTMTLWRLLKTYNIPTFVFVTKMDFARKGKGEIMGELTALCGDGCIDFTDNTADFFENLSLCSEDILEKYLAGEEINSEDIGDLVSLRKCFPVYFGSGLKGDGVDDFLTGLDKYTLSGYFPRELGAKVFKITHDAKGERITHLKITGGSLNVRDTITVDNKTEKINSIRIYSGEKFTSVNSAEAGSICAVTGLSSANCGDGLGFEQSFTDSLLEPVMNYRIVLPDGVDANTFLPKLKELEAEDPKLHIKWNSFLQEIYVSLMGEVQVEILKSIIFDRFNVDVIIDRGTVLYKETIKSAVEGVGHYEPLRHYAEVHLILEPLPRGSGIVFQSRANEDSLSRNWQNLIMTHLAEKEHLGVLTGSPITDIKITLAAGRAHLKHTEGGDFRQSTYRAVRHGLMNTQSLLLEPYYAFRLEIPTEQIGRAINDIRLMHGDFENPVDMGEYTLIEGRAPVVSFNSYPSEVAAYTSGRGKVFCHVWGYDVCHNPEEIIEKIKYSPESDVENTADSVFCAHGAGFNVKWNEVYDYMHIERCIQQEKNPYETNLNKRNFHIDDKELEAIMNREFGADKHPYYRVSHTTAPSRPVTVDYNTEIKNKYVIVDGYNVIFAWDMLKDIAKDNLETARTKLMDVLCNYSAFTKAEVVLVFDAYKVKGNTGKKYNYNNIRIVFTKERELGDNYIEKLISEIGKNDNVRVVTSDNLIRLSAIRYGVVRVSASDFEKEIKIVDSNIDSLLEKINRPRPSKVGELLEILKEQI